MKPKQVASLVPFTVGMILPMMVYQVRLVWVYVRTITRNENKYEGLPQYKEAVKKIHEIHYNLSPYYRALSKNGKRKFINRLLYNLARTQFDGAEGLNITLERKIVVLGTLVQLMFGLKQFILPSFNGVRIYPQQFYSRFLNANVLGLTVPMTGILALSWKDTLEGVLIPDDNRNLALHEWAHAFYFDHQRNIARPLFRRLNRQLGNIKSKFHLLKIEGGRYLRDYAYTNKHEFFSVSVECFFENPATLKSKLPNLFDTLCILLNQNPLNSKNDYRLSKDEKNISRRR
jgi:Mlc titration factor MtfA (ptsG expression regulator)